MGGVICAAMEHRGAWRTAALDAVTDRIRDNTLTVLQQSREQETMPRQAALALADRRLREAMTARRWRLF